MAKPSIHELGINFSHIHVHGPSPENGFQDPLSADFFVALKGANGIDLEIDGIRMNFMGGMLPQREDNHDGVEGQVAFDALVVRKITEPVVWFGYNNHPASHQKISWYNASMANKSTKVLKYETVFEEQPDKGYTVIVPSLPGCISEGDTFEEAKTNIADAIKLYLEDLAHDGEEIPSGDNPTFVGQIEVNRPFASWALMPAYTSKKILHFLQQRGFYITRQSGSHLILHNKDLKPGTLSSVLNQAGIEKKELSG